MKFGAVPLQDAAGRILAHSLRVEDGRIAKGTLLEPAHVEALRRAGFDQVVAARLDDGDVREDEAARRLATAAAGSGVRLREPFTGRCNLVAEAHGLAVVDAAAIHRANAVDEALTLATVFAFAPVRADRLVATAKVIPLAVPAERIERAEAALVGSIPAVRVAPFRIARAGLVLTELPGSPAALFDKAETVTRRRLQVLGSTLATVRRVPHEPGAVAAALAELRASGHDPLLVLGASAVVDRADVVPAAVEAAGGAVERFGIPVDPGNLLLLARLGGVPVLGVPGCARSPRRNGFDQVLERVLAGVGHEPGALAGLGVGGLLAEIPSRPQPREPEPGATGRRAGGADAPGVAVLVLAAGRSSRMGARNKLVADVDGRALVARAVDTALAADVGPVVVVTGHDPDAVRTAVAERPVAWAHNPRHEEGMAGSLAAGIAAVEGLDGPAPRGLLVQLGDMPRVRPATLQALVEALDPDAGRSVCVPVHGHKRGNPVLWAARFLPELGRLEGDVGGRTLLGRYPEEVFEVEVDDPGVLLDVDTPEALDGLVDSGP